MNDIKKSRNAITSGMRGVFVGEGEKKNGDETKQISSHQNTK